MLTSPMPALRRSISIDSSTSWPENDSRPGDWCRPRSLAHPLEHPHLFQHKRTEVVRWCPEPPGNGTNGKPPPQPGCPKGKPGPDSSKSMGPTGYDRPYPYSLHFSSPNVRQTAAVLTPITSQRASLRTPQSPAMDESPTLRSLRLSHLEASYRARPQTTSAGFSPANSPANGRTMGSMLTIQKTDAQGSIHKLEPWQTVPAIGYGGKFCYRP